MLENRSTDTKWIWMDLPQRNQPNQYVEFRRELNLATVPQKACLRISVDTNFAAWVNDTFTGCGQFGDFPEQRTFSQMDITGSLKTGKNVIAIEVHYCGEDHFSYYPGNAGLWYEVELDGKIIARSDEQTFCRQSPCYLQENAARFNIQRGFTFNYDACGEDNWRVDDYRCNSSWKQAGKVAQETVPQPRPLKMLDLRPSTTDSIIAQGLLKRTPLPGKTVAEHMQNDFFVVTAQLGVFLRILPPIRRWPQLLSNSAKPGWMVPTVCTFFSILAARSADFLNWNLPSPTVA